jgi:hypothetical protein
MKPHFFSLLGLLCLPLLAQVGVPKVGVVRYPDGSFHTVQGLPANMIVADLPIDPAQAASFSDGGGLVWQNGAIRLLAADFSLVNEYSVAEKPLLAMDGGPTSALAWLPNSHTLLHWNGTQFDTFNLAESDVEGTVTDLQSAGSRQARLIVLHADNTVYGVTVSLRNGSLISSEPLPGVHGNAFGQSFLIVYASGKELVADNLRGYSRSVPLPASDLVVERMSNDWLHLYSPGLHQNWALHVTQADLNLSMLPGLPEVHVPTAIAVYEHRSAK